MEQKDIDIYEILKDEEHGTELYTPICGRVWHSGMANDKDSAKAIWTEDEAGREHFFDKNGKVSKEGEVLLFPSKEMRDWNNFFKKGDVLEYKKGNNQATCLFDSYEDNTTKLHFTGLYTLTKGKIWDTPTSWDISDWVKSDNPAAYINTIEERLGGKLNRETLEIEETHPEFKDGDVLFVKCKGDDFIEIFKCSKRNGDLYGHASLNTRTHELDISGEYKICEESTVKIRHATEEEKKQLFSALEKEGKAFDAENKQVVDLKPAKGQPAFKTFDKVLVRCGKGFKWLPAFFIRDRGEDFAARYNVLPLHSGKTAGFTSCIPYEGHENFAFTDYDFVDLPF